MNDRTFAESATSAHDQLATWKLRLVIAGIGGLILFATLVSLWTDAFVIPWLTAALTMIVALATAAWLAGNRFKAETSQGVMAATACVFGGSLILVAPIDVASHLTIAVVMIAALGLRVLHIYSVVAAVLFVGSVLVALIQNPSPGLQESLAIAAAAIIGGTLVRYRQHVQCLADDLRETYAAGARRAEQRLESLRNLLHQKTDDTMALEAQLLEAQRMADSDSLTGLANGECVKAFLMDHWLAYRHAFDVISVIIIDLQGFLDYNKMHGYRAGNEALARVAAILADYTTSELALAARVGENRFLLVLPGVDKDAAHEEIEEIRGRVQRATVLRLGDELPPGLDIEFGLDSEAVAQVADPMLLLLAAQASLEQQLEERRVHGALLRERELGKRPRTCGETELASVTHIHDAA